MKKGMTIFIIFVVVILFAASSFAQPRQRMMRGKALMGRSHTRILTILKAKQEELKVTDDQIVKITNLVFSFEEKMIQMRSNSSSQRLELKKLMQDRENLDYEKIRAALSEASKARADIFIEGLILRNEIQKILTPEQRDTLKAMGRDQLRRRRGLSQRGHRMQRFQQLRKRIKK